MSRRSFVQFPHPGGEHLPDDGRKKKWNTLRHQHARAFLEAEGARLSDGEVRSGPIWFWGEWEAEAEVISTLEHTENGAPRHVWRPYWVPKRRHLGLHNTDPNVFGGFRYTDCKQGTSPSLHGLRELAAGSVIAFGSGRGSNGEETWVLDAVLVVDQFVDHNKRTFAELNVSDCYREVTLGPTYDSVEPHRSRRRRLYTGATHDNPHEGMFSFFPCVPAGGTKGFPRPTIELSREFFSKKLKQGAKGHARSIGAAEVKELWQSIVDQVVAQGCDLGVYAAEPSARASV